MYKSERIFSKPSVQIACFAFLALIVHALVLKFIFPGYYSPLYPHHSDFYISVALAHSPEDYFQYRYLGYSRPLGIFFLKFIGSLGIHGAILFTVINVAINCSLSAVLAQRMLKTEIKWTTLLFFSVYCWLLFSQAYFYTFYTQDVFSHLSYSFIITGACIFTNQYKRRKTVAYSALFILLIIAFLCKETYALSAVFCAILWYIYNKRTTGKSSPALPLITVGAIVLVVLFNLIIKSVFTNFNSAATDPYYINLTPASIIKEMALYAKEGLNVLHWIILAIIAVCGIMYFRTPEKRFSYLAIGCILAAVLSWLPNALIPNHHNGGYSFNGAYLLYLPVVFMPVLMNQSKNLRRLTPVLMLAAFISPYFNQKEYAKQWWVLQQENTERHLLKSLDTLMKLQPSAQPHHILVTGLTMPFFPFHHPASLKAYPNEKFGLYDVVDYSLNLPHDRYKAVKFVLPADVQIKEYNSIWLFNNDGNFLRKITVDSSLLKAVELNNCKDLILYPDSIKNQKLSSLIK